MKTSIKLFACALALAAPVWFSVRAANDPSRTTGRVLVLENERTIEGDISSDGNCYRVRRQVGETTVPADKALRLCDSLEEAYDFLRSRANLRDADERLRLAHWCHLRGLHEQASAEAAAAVALRPKSAECRHFLQAVQRAAIVPVAAAPAAASNERNTPAPASIEISAESMGQFAARVQPILMNTCASCHLSDRGGNFKLLRATEGLVNRRPTQQNLAAVLAQINHDHWETSPFLSKAVSIHGEATQPPIKNRQNPAFRNLEDWVKATMADNPRLADKPTATAAGPATAEPKTYAEPGPLKVAFPLGESVSTSRPTNPPPSGPPKPVDPYDPAVFNQGQKK